MRSSSIKDILLVDDNESQRHYFKKELLTFRHKIGQYSWFFPTGGLRRSR